MSILHILKWPDPRLAQTCEPIADITSEIETLIQDMLDTMYDAPGRGLAAPQVGVMKRIFVMDAGWKEGKSDPIVCINPMLQEVSGERVTQSEGCLSIPGVSTDISRPAQVQMVWTGVNGGRFVQSFDGFAAACVQHELDHLDGVVVLDHLRAPDREALIAAYGAQ